MAVGDEAGGDAEEGFVDVVASFPAVAEASLSAVDGERAVFAVVHVAQAAQGVHVIAGDLEFLLFQRVSPGAVRRRGVQGSAGQAARHS